MTIPPSTHVEREDHPWTREIPNHPARRDSAEYRASRARLRALSADAAGGSASFYGPPPYEDHHGGGLWAYEGDDPTGAPFLILNLAGIEWSAQFGADPVKVDLLRANAARFYAGFPRSAEHLGLRELLSTIITDAAGVAAWVDSLCNASVPLPSEEHTGILESGGVAGVHHYPWPVASIPLFAYSDFQVFVRDAHGAAIAVTPSGPRGSGNGGVTVQWAAANSALRAHTGQINGMHRHELAANDPVAIAAFARQT